jgi:cytochrome c oxidase assembly protein subunit 15
MPITRRHRNLLLAASALTLLLVTLGGVVCITGSSRGCPDWPGCYGQLVPPLRLDSILEYTHRLLAGLTSLLIVASAIAGWRRARSMRWVSWPPLMAVAFLAAVVVFGAMVVLRGLEPGLAALDLGSALLVLALMLAATVVAFSVGRNPGLPGGPSFHSPLARLALWTLVAVFVVLVSGVLVAAGGSAVRCLGWPLFGRPLALDGARGWLQLARHLLAAGASILVIAVIVQAWRRGGVLRRAATTVGLLFLGELVAGVLVIMPGYALPLQVLHVAAAAALWAALVVLTMLAGLASHRPAPATRGPRNGDGQIP